MHEDGERISAVAVGRPVVPPGVEVVAHVSPAPAEGPRLRSTAPGPSWSWST